MAAPGLNPTTAKAAKEPHDHQHHDNQAKYAAEAGQAVPAMGIITAAASEQEDQHDNNKEEAHGSPI